MKKSVKMAVLFRTARDKIFLVPTIAYCKCWYYEKDALYVAVGWLAWAVGVVFYKEAAEDAQ